MKLFKMILVTLFLTSVAFANNGNDYVRQLEPNGVFVNPVEYKNNKDIKRQFKGKEAIDRIKNYSKKLEEKKQNTKDKTLVIKDKKNMVADSFSESLFFLVLIALGVIATILLIFFGSPFGFIWMLIGQRN